LAKWLCLAATPTFAIMALLTGLDGSPIDRLCSAGPWVPLSGMVPMYLFMSAFHSPPWLKLIFDRRGAVGRSCPGGGGGGGDLRLVHARATVADLVSPSKHDEVRPAGHHHPVPQKTPKCWRKSTGCSRSSAAGAATATWPLFKITMSSAISKT